MSRWSLLYALLFVLLTVTSAHEDNKKESFGLRTFMITETDHFEMSRWSDDPSSSLMVENTTFHKFSITSNNDTTSLHAHIIAGITSNDFTISFNDQSENIGLVQAPQTSFPFTFTMINHVAISTGKFNDNYSYQWIIPSHDSWIFTIFDSYGTTKEIFIAKKIFVEAEKTFLAKYGTYIMMAVLMALNMWIQNKTQQMSKRQAQAAASVASNGVDTPNDNEFVDGAD